MTGPDVCDWVCPGRGDVFSFTVCHHSSLNQAVISGTLPISDSHIMVLNRQPDGPNLMFLTIVRCSRRQFGKSCCLRTGSTLRDRFCTGSRVSRTQPVWDIKCCVCGTQSSRTCENGVIFSETDVGIRFALCLLKMVPARGTTTGNLSGLHL